MISGLLAWSLLTDLNPRPADYKSAALPTELSRQVLKQGGTGANHISAIWAVLTQP